MSLGQLICLCMPTSGEHTDIGNLRKGGLYQQTEVYPISLSNMKNCIYKKEDDSVCQAKALHDDEFCFWHSEKSKEQREKAIHDGGNSLKRNYTNDEMDISTTNDVIELLVKTINELRQNKTSTKIASTVGYLSGILLKAIEQTSLEKRLEVIEYVLKIRKQNVK